MIPQALTARQGRQRQRTLKSMNQTVPAWTMLVGPVATLLGTMLMVMLGVYLQNRALERAVDLLRAEFKQHLAETELRITRQVLELGA